MVHDETREATIHPPLATSSNHPVPSVAKRLASIAVVQRISIATRVVRQDLIGWASTCMGGRPILRKASLVLSGCGALFTNAL
jgi:hypothetical protein